MATLDSVQICLPVPYMKGQVILIGREHYSHVVTIAVEDLKMARMVCRAMRDVFGDEVLQ